MVIEAVGIASLSYDEQSQKLINMRNQGAMLGDPTVREGYVQGAIARGLEAAGSNAKGAAAGYMGMGFGMQNAGGFMGSASATNMQQMQMNQRWGTDGYAGQSAMTGGSAGAAGSMEQTQSATTPKMAATWTCACGNVNTGKFCSECGSPKPAENGPWTCSCGSVNTGKFCSECGKPRG